MISAARSSARIVHLISIAIFVGILFPRSDHSADGLQKVRIGYPSSAFSTLPFDIASEKGFYAKAGLDGFQAEIRSNRERVRQTIAAVMAAVAWQRANRAEAVKIIAARYKITPGEAEHSYQTMTGILSTDGSMDLKKVHGYLSLLREERPIPETLEPEKLVDFSMLPAAW